MIATSDLVEAMRNEGTEVNASVTLLSRFGQARMRKKQEAAQVALVPVTEEEPKKGLLSSWSASGIQKSIESYGLSRTREAVRKSTEGMNVVLQRFGRGGLVKVLEGMQQDSQRGFGQTGPLKETMGGGDTDD